MEPMNDRPTPETDAVASIEGNWDTKALRMGHHARRLERERDHFVSVLNETREVLCDALSHENQPTAEMARILVRERDEALEEGLEQARLLGMSGSREAQLIRERDDLLDRLTKLELHMPDELARLERERNEAREQRDMLAETLNDLWHHYSLTDAAYALIDAALAAVEGGKHE